MTYKKKLKLYESLEIYDSLEFRESIEIRESMEIYDSLEIRETFEMYESLKQDSDSKNYSKHSFRLISLNQIYPKLMGISRRMELRKCSNCIRSSVIKIRNQKELAVKYTKVRTIKILI